MYVGIQEVVAAYVGSQQVFSSGLDPATLFASGEKGFAYDFTKASTLAASTDGTGSVGMAEQFAYVADLSGNNYHAPIANSTLRPRYQGFADFDGTNDAITTPSINLSGTTRCTLIIGLKKDMSHDTATSVVAFAGTLAFVVGVDMGEYTHYFSLSYGIYKANTGEIQSQNVLIVELDTVPATQAEEIKPTIDGIAPTLTAHGSLERTWGQTLGIAPVVIGGAFNGRIDKIALIDRFLTTEEKAAALAWASEKFAPPKLPGYSADLNFFPIYGQSMAAGSDGGAILTTAQEYDNVMFPVAADAPASYAPAFATGVNTETPMYGAMGHVKELVGEDGADPVGVNYQLLTCNNGYGSYGIQALSKGNATFTKLISQVTAAKSIATTNGDAFRFRATMWLQGEADSGMSYASYKYEMRKLAADLDDMGRAAAVQRESPILIAYQCTTNPNANVALAQLDASIEDPLIYIACPKYPMEHSVGGLHWTAEGAKFGGGYFGLVYKKVVIDGEDWSPVRPLSYVQAGSDVTITMHVPVAPLALDTTLLPAQTNYGFAAFDSGGTPISITGVTLVDTDKVKITTASTIPSGGYITYAQSAQPDPARSLGGCGNLRDSQGASMTYIGKPMHNWCVLFTQVIA